MGFWKCILYLYSMSASILIDINTLENYKSRNLIPFSCEYCQQTFYRTKNIVLRWLKNKKSISCCSKECSHNLQKRQTQLQCFTCKKYFSKQRSVIKNMKKRSKSSYNFCSRSCASIYINSHKMSGYRRSKLEKWIEERLKTKYPKLHIDYNNTTVINAELDIFIPSLRFAVELNGIFHYEPIYGIDKLKSTQTNDMRKFQACLERGIELCIIDTSSQKYFKTNTAINFLNIITNIIDYKISNM